MNEQDECAKWLALSADEKMARLIEHITERHLNYDGGYPYDYGWVCNKLVVAALDPGKDNAATTLLRYTKRELLNWINRANAFAKGERTDGYTYSIAEILGETA